MQKALPIRFLVLVALWLGFSTAAVASLSWYDAAGALAAGVGTSSATSPHHGDSGARTDDGIHTPQPSGDTIETPPTTRTGRSHRDHHRSDDVSVREEAEKFRETMRAVVAEYDKIGAGELAQKCLDASRIVQIAENPTGWREILFLLAGLVSLLAALFITKILASMFKVEIAQLLWIPIAGCIALLAGLFVAIRAAKKRKVAVAAGVALSAAGVISFVDPVRHGFFKIVAAVFVNFTAWYVPLVAVAFAVAGLLFIFFVLCHNAGGVFASIGSFLLRNTIGLVAIPGVCALLFLGILSVVGPWFEGHAGELATTWEGEERVSQTGVAGGFESLESLRLRALEAEREFESLSRQTQWGSSESESEWHSWDESMADGSSGSGVAGPSAQGEPGSPSRSGSRSGGHGGAVPFTAYPKEVRRAAAEMARAAEGVYDGILPRGAQPFDGFLSAWMTQPAVSPHEWNPNTGTFSAQSGLVAQVFRRRTGWRGSEVVVVFRGTASAKDGIKDWRQLLGDGYAPQYADAAALVRSVRNSSNLPMVVLGHSLGGGQTQYAVAMNQGGNEIRGVGFNPAGLSANSIHDIEMRQGEGDSVRAAHSLAMVRLDNDPVSTVGVLLGRVVVVASGGIRGLSAHSITTLAETMERQVNP